jgi:pimeloyl-ACP methyl ester carboxylesterase
MAETAISSPPEEIVVGSGEAARSIAMRLRKPGKPASQATILWLSGYRSDMGGSKAVEVDALAGRLGLGCIRFDYSGHGVSGGAFIDGTISRWLEEALAVLDHAKPKRIVIVGLVLIAPAPDFTIDLIEPHLTAAQRDSLAEKGYFEEPSLYSPAANIYTRRLIDDGRANQVLSGIIETGCPVHILQGMQDKDVPHAHAMKLVEHLPADDVVLTLIRDGDHRLSRPQDLERLRNAVAALAEPR